MRKSDKIAIIIGVLLWAIIVVLAFSRERHPLVALRIPISNSSLAVVVTTNRLGAIECQLFEQEKPVSELHAIPHYADLSGRQRHYTEWLVDKTTYASNVVTIDLLAEDGYDGDPYRIVVDIETSRIATNYSLASAYRDSVVDIKARKILTNYNRMPGR
jgi:hypothetical protein